MKLYPSLSDDLARWAQNQPVFLTGSAGKHAKHINVSPKGMTDTHFAVLGPNKVAYIDRTGSGCETIAHAYENGRLCIMFMSFGDTPRIMRLFCRATVVEWDQPSFQDLIRQISKGKRDGFDGARAVIVGDIWEVQTSCGFGVPRVKKGLYRKSDDDDDDVKLSTEELLHQGQEGKDRLDELCVFETRPTMDKWASSQAEHNYMRKYQNTHNIDSIDGLPGLRASRRDIGQNLWLMDLKAWAKRVAADKEALVAGFGLAVIMYLIMVAANTVLLR